MLNNTTDIPQVKQDQYWTHKPNVCKSKNINLLQFKFSFTSFLRSTGFLIKNFVFYEKGQTNSSLRLLSSLHPVNFQFVRLNKIP